jgi:hypothetical protein
MKNNIAQALKMYSIGYYILPITPSNSNIQYCTEVAVNEEEAKLMFSSHMPDNCRINTVSEIVKKN